MVQIWLPHNFLQIHRQIVLDYPARGHTFNRRQWRQLIIAIDLLKNAFVFLPSGEYSFPSIYRQEVGIPYANWFIEQLYEVNQVQQESKALWASVAQRITPDLIQAGLYGQDIPDSELLRAYCLYWWRSFTIGYALEIQIQRDLAASGIQFQAHDLRQSKARLSPDDLRVSGFKGDIKTSIYFLQASRSRMLPHDFYITRIRTQNRVRTFVVFIKGDMWKKIDGQTIITLLTELSKTLPQASRITHEGTQLIVIEYELWKEKMRQYQALQKGRSP